MKSQLQRGRIWFITFEVSELGFMRGIPVHVRFEVIIFQFGEIKSISSSDQSDFIFVVCAPCK